ncbi:MAG: efflux RND transporter permease subunit [Caldilineales bacterium]|nr:efflux RND transporter permease subunit [Caldilineales bacterium]
MRIWDTSIRQPVFITMLMSALVILGIVSYNRMPVDLFPDVSFPYVAVTTVYPGANPAEVETQITNRLEEELSSLSGLDSISSTSGEGYSVVVMQFTLDTPSDQAAQDVRERLNLVTNQLPTDALAPVVQRFDPADQPIMTFAVADRTGQLDPATLRLKVEDEIQQPLQRIPGVATIDVVGGLEREILVNMDMLALQGKRVAPQQVVGAIQMTNLNIPGGSVPEGDSDVLVRTPGNFTSLQELQDVVVSQRGAPIFLRDVADVIDGFKERTTVTRLNGEESVVFNVRKQSGENTVKVADSINAALEDIRSENPDLDIITAVDGSTFVRDSTADAINDTIWGAILASLVVLFFFRNIRNTILVMIGLPVIMIGTIWGMDLVGISLNLVSLLALAIVVGLVIDDAIVVRENIFRWTDMGYSPREAASKGTAQVVLPVLATSATILAVFLPVAYATGIVGQFLRDFGLTVSIAIIISTIEALTLAPMLAAYFFIAAKKSQKAKKEEIEDSSLTEFDAMEANLSAAHVDTGLGSEEPPDGWMYRFYGRLLNWTLNHKRLTVLFSGIVLALSLLSFPFIDQTFLAEIDQGEFAASLTMPPGTRLDVTEAQAIGIETALRNHPDVANVFTSIGGQGAAEQATFQVKLVEDSDRSTRDVMDELRNQLAGTDGLAFQLTGGAFDFGFVGLGGRDVVIEIKSATSNMADLAAATDQVMAQLAQIPGLTDVESSLKTGKPEMRLVVDEQRAAANGLSTAAVGATIRTLLTGEVASTYRGDQPEADIRVQLDESFRDDLETVLNYKLMNQSGQLVPLRNVASAELAEGPVAISRTDRQTNVTIGANRSGRSEAEVLSDVNAVLANVQLPAGVAAELGGQAAQQADAFKDLFLSLALSVVFVYMVLASQFRSFTQPGIIMLAMPLAVIGAILALFLTGNPLDMTAMIGFIMLMGLATKNSILLVDFANQERERGVSPDEAMRRAGPVRLRPILMTAISLILGMLPVALGLGPGGSFRAPLAIGVIGGMTTSTFLTLIIVPVAYVIWVGFQDRFFTRRAERKAAKEAKEAAKAAQQSTSQTAQQTT